MADSFDPVRSVLKAFEDALEALYDSSALFRTTPTTADELRSIVDGLVGMKGDISAVDAASQALLDAINDANAELASDEEAIRTSLRDVGGQAAEDAVFGEALAACSRDSFQGISFFDGTSYGSLRVFEDRVELLVDEVLTFDLDGTIPHTYRLCGQDDDVYLYVDGQLAIDGTGKFTRPTAVRQVEFGSISSRGNDLESAWDTFRYSVDGCHPPADAGDPVLTEVVSLPDGSVGRLKAYNNALYATLDPNNPTRSSSIYRYEEGQEDEFRTVLAVTRSNVTAVLIDPSRDGNIFGTTGKFLGTDRGLQYILGGKPMPYEVNTFMSEPPEDGDWQLENNCDGNSASIFGGVLTIDTRPEFGTKYWKYVQRRKDDPWVARADNERGWTVEARVRVGDDGSATFFEDVEDSDPTSPYDNRDVVIVIANGSTMADDDKSASAKQAARLVLGQLRRQDRFAVVSFDDSVRTLSDEMLDATQDNVAAALEFVDNLGPIGGSDMLPAMTTALGYPMTAARKVVVLISDGQADSNPYTILSTTRTTNASGPAASINVLGLSGTIIAETPVYKYMLDQLSIQNAGITSYLQASDILEDKVLLFWRGAGGPVFDFEPGGAGTAGVVNASTSFVASADTRCESSYVSGDDPDQRGIAPPDDDLNAPGIVINDGRFQEVVQFFRNGVRLKYAKVFASLDMTSRYQSIRIIGKGKAIGVYAKADDERNYRQLISAPDGLYVRSFEVSSQERPQIVVDATGVTHSVWQDTQAGSWKIFYSKTVAKDVIDRGSGLSSAGSAFGTDIIQSRAGFGLSPAARTSLDGLPERVVVAGGAMFQSKGVKAGDKIAIYGDGAPSIFSIQAVIDEWILLVDTGEADISSLFSGSDYVVYRDEEWSPPIVISTLPGDSNNPTFQVFSDGNIYVAYDNDGTGDKEIYATRIEFNPSYISVKETVRVSNTPGRSTRPSIIESQGLVAAWDETEDNQTHVVMARVGLDDFGTANAPCYKIIDLTPDSTIARRPRLIPGQSIGNCSQDVVVVYEDNIDGQFDIFAKQVASNNSIRSTTKLTSGVGDSVNPFVGARDPVFGRIIVGWENDALGNKELYASIGACAEDSAGTSVVSFDAPLRITNSRGDSRNGSLMISGGSRAGQPSSQYGDVVLLFESDRRRPGYSDIYAARLHPTLGWISSGQGKLDVRVENYMASCTSPAGAFDSMGNVLMVFEATKDGQPSRVGRTIYDPQVITMDESVVGYFPLDDDAGDTTVINRVSGLGASIGSVNNRDVVIVLQASSSMADELASAVAIAKDLLDFLETDDSFTIVTFSSAASTWIPSVVQATPANLTAGKAFLDAATAGGDADVSLGMETALSVGYTTSEIRSRVIILLGDATPLADNAQTAASVREANQATRATIYAVGFGEGPNTDLLDVLARDGDGVSLLLEDQSTTAMSASLANVALSGSSRLPEINGVASDTTNTMHVDAADTGSSLLAPADQGAFDLKENGQAFKIDKVLLGSSGALEFVTKPHWSSTDVTERVFLGNGPLATTDPNTMAFGFTSSSSLLFRLVDGAGFVHETEVGSSDFSWAAEDLVHFRLTWDSEAIGISTINDLFMLDSTTGLACGQAGRIFRTTNGGEIWGEVKTPVTYDLFSLDFVNSSTGFACGELGTVLVTTDGGLTWEYVDTKIVEDINSIYFRTTSIGYIAGSDGLLARSTDGGATWTKVVTSAVLNFYGISHLRQGATTAVVAIGAGGQIYRSIDDGVSYSSINALFAEEPASNRYVSITQTHQAGDYTTYVVGNLGTVLRTTDAGETWESLVIDFGQGYLPNLYDVSHGPDSDHVYIVGANGLLGHSLDGGDTWQLCATAVENGPLTAIDANIFGAGSNLEIFVGGVGGTFLKSEDAGETQVYYIVRSGNLSIQVNGNEPAQARRGDLPFSWAPSSNDLYFGDYRFSGDRTANAEFDEIYVYKDSYPAIGQAFRRRDLRIFQAENPQLVHDPEMEKRIEWGNISDLAKASSYWTNVKFHLCGAVEPLWAFAWTTQLGLVDDVIRDMMLDRGGRLWIATENGISSFDAKGASVDIENWLQGLRPLKNQSDRFLNYSNLYDGLPSDSVSSISVDDRGTVWAGTDAGLLAFPDAATGSNSIGTTFSDTGIDPIEQKRQQVMAEMGGSADPKFNIEPQAASRVFTTDDGLPSNKIMSVRVLNGNVFVGTDKGLAILVPQGGSITQDVTDAVNAVQAGSSLLQAGEGLVDNLQNSTQSVVPITGQEGTTKSAEAALPNYEVRTFSTRDGLPSNLVRAIVQEKRNGDIWIGTDKGVARFFPEGSINYAISNGLPNNDVYSIWLDDDDNKYVGTGSGLARISGASIAAFLPSSGLGPGAIQYGAVDANGVKWMATSLGLVGMDDVCDDQVRFTRYSFEDGLLGDGRIRDFQFYRMLGGEIPSGGCDRALVSVIVNGELIGSGYKIMPRVGHSPMIVFEEPLQAADRVDVFVRPSWRKAFDFTGDFRNRQNLATVEMPQARMYLRRKRFQAGTITLGANFSKGAGNPSARMYGVFVVPVSGSGTVITSVDRPTGALAALDAGKGSTIYVDSTDAIQVIPAEVLGAEFIKLYSADAEDQSLEYLEFTVSADVIVYVAFDSRAGSALPYWLRSFEPVKATYRVTDLETFTDASGEEKLFMSVSGTTGCVYDLLSAPDNCDISDSIAVDTEGPTGCATISRVNSATNVSLSIQASDPITGVADMQVSHREDFQGATWIPFATTHNLQLPAGSTNVATIVPEVESTTGPTPPAADFQTNTFFNYQDQVLITSSNPGRVYTLDRSTNQATLLFDTGEDEVLSLEQFGDSLLVGTGPDGKVFRWDGSSLTQLTLSAGESMTAMAVFDTQAFFGTSPNGLVYVMDEDLNVSLFKDTFETKVTAFAVFGGRLFWTTANNEVAEGNVIWTTTRSGHRHSFTIPAGVASLDEVNGTTSEADGHSHDIVNGVVQEASGHAHALNGVKPGKVFRYDLALGLTTIVHADRDFEMSALASSSLGGNGLLFAGSYPNGKILRYVPSKNHFIKSFDTTKDRVARLKLIDDKIYAIAGDDVFFFDGKRWQFIAGTGEDINDITISGGQVLLLGDNKVLATKTSAGQAPAGSSEVCAYVRFRDVGGNVSIIRDSEGEVEDCYNPCSTVGGGSTGASGGGGGTGGTTGNTSGTPTGSGGGEDPAMALTHRLLEIDENANVLFAMDGDEAFLSGDKVEEEVGTYYSEIFNGTNSLVQWVSMTWDATVPAGASLTFAVRSATTLAGVSDAAWSTEYSASGVDLTSLRGQWLQFRATLKVLVAGVQSPELRKVDIELRTSHSTHFFTTNFALPDDLHRGILAWNGCVNPPVTDIVFGLTGNDTTDFSDYLVISPNKAFEIPPEHQRKNLRVGIRLISSPTSVPVVDEFALLFSLANDAIIRLNLTGMPTETTTPPDVGPTRTVVTEKVQGHVHTITFDSSITDKFEINGTTSINAGHSHDVVGGVVQPAAGHAHEFEIE